MKTIPSTSPQSQHLAAEGFLAGGGAMGGLMSRYDWTSTPLGPPDSWPQSLRTAVSICLTTPFVSAVHWGPQLRILYNDAYAPALVERHPSVLGKPFCQVWPELWEVLGPQIAQVLEAGRGFAIENQHLRMERLDQVEDTYWTYSFAPIHDESGGIGGVFVTALDNTANVLAERRSAADTLRQRQLFGQAPGFIAIIGGSDHRFEFANRAYEGIVGRTDLIGKTVREALPDIEGQGFFELLDSVFRTGKPFLGERVPLEVQPNDGQPKRLIYVDFVYQPVVDPDGSVTGIFVEGYDVTARVAAESQQKLLVDEMNHRVKNVLSTVQALTMLTGKSALTVADFKASLTNRIQAMAKTQDLLIRGYSQPVEVCELLENELTPYGLTDRVELLCGSVKIQPKNAVRLGLLVHELATNAAKYGALASLSGKLSVRCEAGGAQATLFWREVFEATTPPKLGGGFGTILIKRLATELRGSALLTVSRDGFEAVVTFQLTDEA